MYLHSCKVLLGIAAAPFPKVNRGGHNVGKRHVTAIHRRRVRLPKFFGGLLVSSPKMPVQARLPARVINTGGLLWPLSPFVSIVCRGRFFLA